MCGGGWWWCSGGWWPNVKVKVEVEFKVKVELNIIDSKVIEPMVIELLGGYWDRSRSLTKVKVIGGRQGRD